MNGSRGGFVRGLSDAFSQYLTVSDQMQQRRAEQERQRKLDEEAAKRAQVAEYLQRENLKLSQQQNQRAEAGFEAEQFGRGFTKLAPERAQGMADLAPMAHAPTAPGGMAQAGSGLGAMADFLGKVGNQAKTATGGWAKTNYSTGERKEANDLYDAEQQRKARAAEGEAERIARAKERAEDRAADDARLNKQLGNARQIASMRMADDGQPPAPKTLPMGVESALAENVSVLTSIDDAEGMLEAGKGAGAFGRMRGIQRSLGMERVGQSPDDIDLAAAVGNIASQQIKLRSGAAVTAGEWPRLRPFIPVLDGPGADDAVTVRKKLQKMREIIAAETEGRAGYYEGQGYAVPKIPQKPAQKPAPDVRRDRPPIDSFVVRR